MITYELLMKAGEEKPITVQVLDLQASETVADATITHVPPSGTPLTIPKTISSPYINMIFGPFTVVGRHTVTVQAIGSATPRPSKPVVVYGIEVKAYDELERT